MWFVTLKSFHFKGFEVGGGWWGFCVCDSKVYFRGGFMNE